MLGMLRRRTTLHPLAAAAERGHLAVVRRLLELGALPGHDRSVWAGVAQCTPLMLAAGEAAAWRKGGGSRAYQLVLHRCLQGHACRGSGALRLSAEEAQARRGRAAQVHPADLPLC